MRFRMLPAATALVAVALLVGCVPQDPVIAPVPEPSSSPVFASDEEALAAATEAYGRYLEVSDRIRSDPGEDPAAIARFVTTDRLSTELEGFRDFRRSGYLTIGNLTFDGATLQRYVDVGGEAEVVIYVCMDATSVKFVNAAGETVSSPNKPKRERFEVAFKSDPSEPARLLLARSELWPKDSGC